MNPPIERRRWAIAEGYVPGWSNGPEPQFTSHETAYLLNASDEDAHLEITMFSDRELVDLTVSRSRHDARCTCASTSSRIPSGSRRIQTTRASSRTYPSSCSTHHTWLDSRQAENALRSTIAYASNE